MNNESQQGYEAPEFHGFHAVVPRLFADQKWKEVSNEGLPNSEICFVSFLGAEYRSRDCRFKKQISESFIYVTFSELL